MECFSHNCTAQNSPAFNFLKYIFGSVIIKTIESGIQYSGPPYNLVKVNALGIMACFNSELKNLLFFSQMGYAKHAIKYWLGTIINSCLLTHSINIAELNF